jgi:hypothetical protein
VDYCREYYVDLIAKPGCLFSPRSILTNSPWSFCTPVVVTPFQQYKGSVEEAPFRALFPSGFAEITFRNDEREGEVWAILKLPEHRAYSIFKDQLRDQRRKGMERTKVLYSGRLSFLVGINPDLIKDRSIEDKDSYESTTMPAPVREPSEAARKLERMASDEHFEIKWEDIAMGRKVGSGQYGTVYRATWHGSVGLLTSSV